MHQRRKQEQCKCRMESVPWTSTARGEMPNKGSPPKIGKKEPNKTAQTSIHGGVPWHITVPTQIVA
eukprot:1240030-Amphidinium_carterae.1